MPDEDKNVCGSLIRFGFWNVKMICNPQTYNYMYMVHYVHLLTNVKDCDKPNNRRKQFTNVLVNQMV